MLNSFKQFFGLRAALAAVLGMCVFSQSFATGSGIVWIPSTDVQPFKIVRLGIDNYFTIFKKGAEHGGMALPTDMGLTIGLLPFSFFNIEVGCDLMEPQDSPWSLNAKAGIPEKLLFSESPAIAVGASSIGFQKNVTDYNIIFGVVSKNIPLLGRLTCGYYWGNEKILSTRAGIPDNHGIMAGWDRAMPEISDNLVFAADYQDGEHAFGALSFGATWNFTKEIGVMIGYNLYNKGYFPNTFTTQLDINL